MGDQINIFENILQYYLRISLALRFDICTCPRCREAMMKCLLSKFTPVYIDPHSSDLRTAEREIVKKHWQLIFDEVTKALEYVSKNPPHAADDNKEEAFANLLLKIKEDRGVDFTWYHPALLKRRIALRLIAKKVDSYIEYRKVLANDPVEYEKLFEVLTINVSEFFRDIEVWATIKIILEAMVEENSAKGEPIVIWSAGCALGEEPYSLAILCRQIGQIGVPVKIYATDIDKDCLQRAQQGCYDALGIDKTQNILKNYFSFDFLDYFEKKDNKYWIKDEIKKMVEFSYLDLTGKDYLHDINLIICRNVFIYFTKPLQEKILDQFYHSLADKGYLIIGKNETLVYEARLVFKEIDLHGRVYQKIKI
jgi:chemotaxis methyl-accepting protein methylase